MRRVPVLALLLTAACGSSSSGAPQGSDAGGGASGPPASDGGAPTGTTGPSGGPTGPTGPGGLPEGGTPPASDAGAPGPIGLLPDTTDGIHLFADQLAGGYSTALVHFVVTHFDGTQKMLKADNDVFRAANPKWLLLHYRLGSSSGPAQYIHLGQWSSDWADVTTHEDWFMHNQNGQRHDDPTDQWDINDISNAGFRGYWVSSVLADMRATGAQGVFADSFEAGISGYGVTDPDTRFDGTNPANPAMWPNGDTWVNQKAEWIAYVEAAFAATPERFLFVPNIGAMITGWSNIDYGHVDGAMLEGFAYQEAPSDWVLGMNRAMKLTSAGKLIIVQSYPQDVPGRQFLLATYLLLKGSKTFVNLAGSGVNYIPEYGIDFGAPKAGLPADVSGYQFSGVYRRDFAKGMVLVNPGDASVSVTLPATYQQVSATGGGVVTDAQLDASGKYTGGSLS
ncbi:MAG TPA: putative glycoside hydrolase, partial [Polyangiaceae bacterium]